MKRFIGLTALVVRDYDEALTFYVGVLGFKLIEDTYIAAQDKRWVVIAPQGSSESSLYGNLWDLVQPASQGFISGS